MASVKFKVRYNQTAIKNLEKASVKALSATAEALKTEVMQANVVPRHIGDLEDSMAVDNEQAANGKVKLTFSTAYARRLYFHPEYNFRKTENENAKGKWLEDWLPGGSKEDFVPQAFASLYKKYTGV